MYILPHIYSIKYLCSGAQFQPSGNLSFTVPTIIFLLCTFPWTKVYVCYYSKGLMWVSCVQLCKFEGIFEMYIKTIHTRNIMSATDQGKVWASGRAWLSVPRKHWRGYSLPLGREGKYLNKIFGGGKVCPQEHFPSQPYDTVSISFFDTKSDVMKTFAGKRVFREAERLYRYWKRCRCD